MTEHERPGRAERDGSAERGGATGPDGADGSAEPERPSRAMRRGAALLVLLLVGGVSLVAWEEPDEASVETLGNDALWAIWTGAALLSSLAAAVLFRREREMRIGILQGLVLGLGAALVVLWVGVTRGA